MAGIRKLVKPVTAKKPGKPKSPVNILAGLRRRIKLSHSPAEKQLYMKRLTNVKRDLARQRSKAA